MYIWTHEQTTNEFSHQSSVAASTVIMAAQLNSILAHNGGWGLGISVFLSCLLFLSVNRDHVIKVVLAANFDENRAVPSLPGVPVMNYLKALKFSEGYANQWGGQHQNVSKDESSVTLTLDRSSGSGFKSKEPYMHGFFNAAVKLQAGYTAGIITSFYLSNGEVYEGWHDEIDIEFLGTIPGEPYTLQTNIYGNGTGDGSHFVGREQRFHLWFDPTKDFHNYTIIWTSEQIMFMVDSIPIRRFPMMKSLGLTYPSKPMSVYATIWDASSWATDGGRHKANYTYQPFLAEYTNFITIACPDPLKDAHHDKDDHYCSQRSFLGCVVPPKLNEYQLKSLEIVQKKYMVYDYCKDFRRHPKGSIPECAAVPASSITSASSEY